MPRASGMRWAKSLAVAMTSAEALRQPGSMLTGRPARAAFSPERSPRARWPGSSDRAATPGRRGPRSSGTAATAPPPSPLRNNPSGRTRTAGSRCRPSPTPPIEPPLDLVVQRFLFIDDPADELDRRERFRLRHLPALIICQIGARLVVQIRLRCPGILIALGRQATMAEPGWSVEAARRSVSPIWKVAAGSLTSRGEPN